MTTKNQNKILATNKQAQKKYRRVDCFEAGIKLTGSEVKSAKAGRSSLDSAYVIIRGGEAFAINVQIPAWQPHNQTIAHELDRSKKLLLSKKELRELEQYDKKKGFAIILFSLYNKKGLIKAEICVSSNKSTRDKREEIKKRDTNRDLRRSIKYR